MIAVSVSSPTLKLPIKQIVGVLPGTPSREFWRERQREYPALARLARDILSIPATGADVERLFNSARDICHCRRASLNATTIQELMMFMCTSGFEVEDNQLALNKEHLTINELQEARDVQKEEHDAQLGLSLEPIIGDEDDGIVVEEGPTSTPSERAAGNRRSIASKPDLGLTAASTDIDEILFLKPSSVYQGEKGSVLDAIMTNLSRISQ